MAERDEDVRKTHWTVIRSERDKAEAGHMTPFCQPKVWTLLKFKFVLLYSMKRSALLILLLFLLFMAVKTCITCDRKFQDTHALKSHQPKCSGRETMHQNGLRFRGPKAKHKPKNISRRKLSKCTGGTEEEIILERQHLRDNTDVFEPARKQIIRREVSTLWIPLKVLRLKNVL